MIQNAGGNGLSQKQSNFRKVDLAVVSVTKTLYISCLEGSRRPIPGDRRIFTFFAKQSPGTVLAGRISKKHEIYERNKKNVFFLSVWENHTYRSTPTKLKIGIFAILWPLVPDPTRRIELRPIFKAESRLSWPILGTSCCDIRWGGSLAICQLHSQYKSDFSL